MTTHSKTQSLAEELIIQPTTTSDNLNRLCKFKGVDAAELKKVLAKKAQQISDNRKEIQKPPVNKNIKEFRSNIHNDIREIDSHDNSVIFLNAMIQRFTLLSSSDTHTKKYFDVKHINAKISHLRYKLDQVYDTNLRNEHDYIVLMINQLDDLDHIKIPSLVRKSSDCSIDDEPEPKVAKTGFWGFGRLL